MGIRLQRGAPQESSTKQPLGYAQAAESSKTNAVSQAAQRADQRANQLHGSSLAFKSFESTSGSSDMSMGRVDLSLDLNPLLDGMAVGTTDDQLYDVYKDMYYFDSVCGSATDFYASFAFSDYTLSGASDKYLADYWEVLDRLHLKNGTSFSRMFTDHLVTGAYCGSMLYNKEIGKFIDLMSHRVRDVDFTLLPFASQDPIMFLTVPEEYRRWMNLKSTRVDALKKRLGADFCAKLQTGKIELDPVGTLFLPRSTMSCERGVSWYRRALPFYLIEKNLFRGTLVESSRRHRGIMHIQMGDGDQWEPSTEELQEASNLFNAADADPLGAIVATRTGVEINEVRCLSGDTLVDTDKGLLRLGSIADHGSKPTTVAVDFCARGWDGKYARVVEWHYRGKRDAVRVTTKTGTKIECTEDHKFLTVVDGELCLREIQEIAANNWPVLHAGNKQSKSFTKKLSLVDDTVLRSDSHVLQKPTTVTEDLAYALGIIVSEGYIPTKGMYVGNTDLQLLETFGAAFGNVFGHDLRLRLRRKAGVKEHNRKSMFGMGINSVQVVSWLSQLGCVVRDDVYEGLPSHVLRVPSCILESDVSVYAAFLAGFINGDGSVVAMKSGSEIRCYSSSESLLLDIKAMLSVMGVQSRLKLGPKTKNRKGICHRLQINTGFASILYDAIEERLISRKQCAVQASKSNKSGVPAAVVADFISDRFVSTGPKGLCLLDDAGNSCHVPGLGYAARHIRFARSYLNPSVYAEGGYDQIFDMLSEVSPKFVKNVRAMLDNGYEFDYVASVEEIGKIDLYDLTMEDSTKPIFTANGLLVKNSGGDFWKITDIIDQTGQHKIRALGINDAFLSGDVNYNTAETAISVLMESIKSTRDAFTRNSFYRKIFPMIAMTKGYAVSSSGKVTRKQGMLNGDINEIMHRMADGSKLLIPTINWSKSFKPEGDQSYMEMLKGLQELGVPVPLRALAAAGGISLDALLRDQAEDIEIQKRIVSYAAEVDKVKKKMGPKEEAAGGGGGLDSFSSTSDRLPTAVLGTGGRVPLKSRDFGNASEIVGRTRTGKPKLILDQKAANERANAALAKAASYAHRRQYEKDKHK